MDEMKGEMKDFKRAFMNWTCDEYINMENTNESTYDVSVHPQLFGSKDKLQTITMANSMLSNEAMEGYKVE